MIPKNITKEHLKKAIKEIDKKGIRKGRHSSTYDLVHEEKSYPPKLVISIANKFANGLELNSNDFSGGKGTAAFELLENEGFVINKKERTKISLYDILIKVKPKAEGLGFKFKHFKENSRYVWIEDQHSIIGDKTAHFEIIARKNSVYLEMHFEDSKTHTFFHSKLSNNSEKLKWFKWNKNGQSIRYSQYNIEEENLHSKLINDLTDFDNIIGNEIRTLIDHLKVIKENGYKEKFSLWLSRKYGESSGASNSYIKALEILSHILSKDLFKITNDIYLETLYKDLIQEQKKQNGKYFHSKAPSYGSNGFYSASIKSYRKFLKSINQTDPIVNNKTMNFPLNTILYGPPGTGKTYNTILRAAQIIENRIIDTYDEALEIFKANLHDRIEFITFHQNYSYEDFIQGLRPETDNKSSLVFKKKDGVFKKIADKALDNIRFSEKAPKELSNETQFNIALEKFQDVVIENEDNYAINDTAYIFEVEEDAFRYTGEKWTNHSNGLRMKFSDLKEFYRNDVKSRKDIKKLTSISGLANQHATYYFLVFDQIIKYLPKEVVSPQKIEKLNYVIIIDEINRANISRVFGELITLIEPDKRSHGTIPLEARLPSGDPFIVPSNLFIIGTMNTADKSIALLDIALRRRFEFESMYPKYEIKDQEIYDVNILKKINEQIIKSKGHDFQIGHAYFMGENNDLVERMNKKVIPLLLEYYMNDEKEVKSILNAASLKIEDNSWPLKISDKND